MRILHVVPSFGQGGMEKIICTLVNSTLDFDHMILSLDQRIDAHRWIKGNKTQYVEFEKSEDRGQFFRALYRVLKKIRPDLLMTYNWGATDGIWLGRLAGISRVIHSEHGFNVDEGKTTNWKRDAVRCFVYRLASRLIVVSRELETLLRRNYLLRANHVTRIPNGIDTSYYSPDPVERLRIRKTLGFEDYNVVVGFSGRLDLIKNLGLLLKIFACCVREHPNLRLLMVGDGPERRRLETLCQENKLQNHVVFTGQQENVLSFLRSMDIFLLTSLREQMPMAVLEAMAVGIPIIATKVGEVPYIIDDGVNGYIHEVGVPVGAFVRSLFALLFRPDRIRMGKAARHKMVDHFQEQNMVQRYKAVIQDLSQKEGRL
jgi:glycosyltransferase involved in cell wall biosynthesis